MTGALRGDQPFMDTIMKGHNLNTTDGSGMTAFAQPEVDR